jgi:hypothetical protein
MQIQPPPLYQGTWSPQSAQSSTSASTLQRHLMLMSWVCCYHQPQDLWCWLTWQTHS